MYAVRPVLDPYLHNPLQQKNKTKKWTHHFSFSLFAFLCFPIFLSLVVSFTPLDSRLSSLLFFSLIPSTFPHGWVWQGHGFKDVQAPECRSAIGAELPIRNSCAFVGHSLCLLRPAAIAELYWAITSLFESPPALKLQHFVPLSSPKNDE